MKETPVNVESRGEVIARGWRSGTVTKALLVAGIVAAGVYVVGDVLSGVVYNGDRPYSFVNQWISELTATGSPVRPLMVGVITIHDLLLIAFGVGILRAAGQSRSLRWTGLVLIVATALGLVIHPFFPMTSRWSFTDTPMHGTLSMVWGVIIFVAVGLSAVAYLGRFRLYAIVTDVFLADSRWPQESPSRGSSRTTRPWQAPSSASTPTPSWRSSSCWP